jgi:hypothetical protein
MIEVFVVIKDGTKQYYLLKIQMRYLDVYCIPPYLGAHFSLHTSGKSHIKIEDNAGESEKEPPVVLQSGEAGKCIDNNIICASLRDIGRAAGICTAHYPIDSLGSDFQEFNRKPKECFVIDKKLYFRDVRGIEIGVWAVPERNKSSFEFNNSGISKGLLHKVTKCEPQIWIYARTSALFAQ